MTKKQIFYASLFASVAIISSSFKPFDSKLLNWFYVFDDKELSYTVPTKNEVQQSFFNFPFSGKTFIGFQESLGSRESRCIYNKVNTFGYLGKYQFGVATLNYLGIKDTNAFLRNRDLQDKAFMANLSLNKWYLQDEIEKYSGSIIRGVEITESGILAAAHLGGVGSIKIFLRTNGIRRFKDGYGTCLLDYLKDFGGFDTSIVIPNKNAKAKHY
jgi:hypothetical protein